MQSSELLANRVWRSFVRAKAEIGRALHRDLRERGLTGAQFGILRTLANSGGEGLQLNELSQQLYVTSGNVTGLIDRLEEAGYLARTPHPEDRRVTLAVLTPAGQELFEQIHPVHVGRIVRLLSTLGEQEQVLLCGLLERIADGASNLDR